MKELQGLLGETNLYLENFDMAFSLPINDLGAMYEVSDSVLPVTRTVGLAHQLCADYDNLQGIGSVVPPIDGLPKVLAETEGAASKVMAIIQGHGETLKEMSKLCHTHITNTFPHQKCGSKGGIFRIQITAQSALFQILFPVGQGVYDAAYEGDLSVFTDEGLLEQEPFSEMPLNMMIPDSDGSGNYVPVTYERWKAMLDNIPLNFPFNPKKKIPQMYRSKTADVLGDFGEMVEELMAA